MEADWDLLAVVRGCTSTTTTATTGGVFQVADVQQSLPPPPPPAANFPRIAGPELEAAYGGFFSSGFEDLGDLYKPFFPNLKRPPISNSLCGGGFIREQEKPQPRPQAQEQAQAQQIVFQQHPQRVKESQVIFGSIASSVSPASTAAGAASIISVGSIFTSQSQRASVLCSPTTSTATTTQTQQRAKKRKNLQKKVCHVPAEGLSSDMWAWRKYGQKPIKGSPYPRGYYRCSSSKGCPARKQVERNRSNPKMFIVTYTSEHNHPMPTHRNSLAGSTRQKPASGSDEATGAATSPSTNSTGNDHLSSPTASPCSAMTEKGEVKTEYEEDMAKEESSGNEMEFPEMVMNDDFFVGFEELDDMDTGDVFLDQAQGRMEMEYPWLSNSTSSSSSTATAAGGS
ncbi:hypothetical protein V2J09_024313 [Rumex salicifolius]